MLRSISRYGEEGINLYINVVGYHYYKYGKNFGKHSFLIPRVDYNTFIENKLDEVEVCFSIKENGEKVWYTFNDKSVYIFDNVYGHENYFEFKVDGMIIKMDEVDLRDLKIRKILENGE